MIEHRHEIIMKADDVDDVIIDDDLFWWRISLSTATKIHEIRKESSHDMLLPQKNNFLGYSRHDIVSRKETANEAWKFDKWD